MRLNEIKPGPPPVFALTPFLPEGAIYGYDN